MLDARLGNFARQSLGDLYCLSNTSAFGDNAGDVGARRHVTPRGERLNVQANRSFAHFSELLPAL